MAGPLPERCWPDRHLWQIQPIRDLLWVGLGVLLVVAAYQLRAIFVPVLIAFGLAYLSMPVIAWAGRRWRLPPQLTIALLLLLFILALAGLGLWLGPLIGSQIAGLAKRAPDVLRALSTRLGSEWGTSDFAKISAKLARSLQEKPFAVFAPLLSGSEQTFNIIERTIGATTYFLLTLGLLPIYFWYFALQFDTILQRLLAYVPPARRQRVLDIAIKLDRTVGSYIRGRVIVSAIMAAAFAAGWSPLLTDVPYWLLMALVTGLLSLVPYCAAAGWLTALVLKAIAISSATDAGLWHWLVGLGGPTIVFAVIQGAEHFLMTPWVQSRSTDLSLVGVILSILVGGAVAGILGMLVAIPFAACAKVLLQETVLPHRAADVQPP